MDHHPLTPFHLEDREAGVAVVILSCRARRRAVPAPPNTTFEPYSEKGSRCQKRPTTSRKVFIHSRFI